MNTLAERLTWARTSKNMSQTELAKKAGVSQSTIGNLEAGLRKTAKSVTAIAAALHVNPFWLADGKGTPELGAQAVIEPELGRELYSKQLQEIITLVSGVDEEGQTRALFAVKDCLNSYRNAPTGVAQIQELLLSVDDPVLKNQLQNALNAYNSLIDGGSKSGHNEEQQPKIA